MRCLTLAVALVLCACARQVPATPASPSIQYSISAPCQPLPYALGGRPPNFRPRVPSSMEAGERRIDSLTSLVDTIIVHPDSLGLHVGQSVKIRQDENWEGRRANGDLVPTFGAWLDVEDRSTARFEERGLVGLKVGLTRVVVSAFSGTPGIQVHAPPSCIKILVEP